MLLMKVIKAQSVINAVCFKIKRDNMPYRDQSDVAMSNFNKTLSKRLRLNHAYGQLIALILCHYDFNVCWGFSGFN